VLKNRPLPPAVLSALGLAAAGCSAVIGPCLKVVATDTWAAETPDAGEPTDTATPSASLAAPSRAPLDRDALLEQMRADGSLPDDVIRRLGTGPGD